MTSIEADMYTIRYSYHTKQSPLNSMIGSNKNFL